MPKLGQLIYSFVSQRAGARDYADITRLVDISGHDPDFAFAGSDYAGAVGTDQAAIRFAHVLLDLDHVEDRHALGDTDDQFDSGRYGFENRVGGERRRHIDYCRIRAGRFARLLDGVENRDPFEIGAALAGTTPPTIWVPYCLQARV